MPCCSFSELVLLNPHKSINSACVLFFVYSKLQETLPDHGLKEFPEPVQDLDGLYDMYVKEETNKNWKFWIVSFLKMLSNTGK